MQLCRCDSFTPRGGGQRDRVTITNVMVRICESLPISPTPLNGTTLVWFWVGMIPKKGVGQRPHPSRAVSAPVPPRKEQYNLQKR